MKVDSEKVVRDARAACAEIALEIDSVHGPLWSGRETLARLVLSLSSGILVGTITFAQTILATASTGSFASWSLVISWCFLFGSILLGLWSLHLGNTLRSFHARFVNSEPDIRKEASELNFGTQEELLDSFVGIVRKYSDTALEPLGSADIGAERYLRLSLITFAIGLGVFIICGGLQIT